MKNRFLWGIACLIVAILLALVSVQLPSQIKKIGIFSCLLGAVAGFFCAWLKEKFSLKQNDNPSRNLLEAVFAFFVGLFLESLRLTESFRTHVSEHQKKLQREMKELPILPPDLEAELQGRMGQTVFDYLSVRYSSLETELSVSACYSLVAIEIVLCGIFASIAFWYCSSKEIVSEKSKPSETKSNLSEP